MKTIFYNKPYLTGNEIDYILKAYKLKQLAGNGFFTKKCQKWMHKNIGGINNLLTHSATAALEMMAILGNIEPGDEVIIPDYTFVSTANAFVLRRGVPVFVDIRSDTLNINEKLIEQAITKRTKAIVPVHYAGVACEMDEILKIAKKYNLLVLEDAAQGFLAKYKDSYLGTIGDMAAFSFHETKNIISGEGGALIINNKKFNERAKVIWEKGTNRDKFFQGIIDKYTWVDIGSSFLPGEVVSAFLAAQLEKAKTITNKRKKLWNYYHKYLNELELKGYLRRPIIPNYVVHNAHLYFILARNGDERKCLINYLAKHNIHSVTHYIPLHSSPAGKKFSRSVGNMNITNDTTERLIRLPLYYDLTEVDQEKIIEVIYSFYR